MESDAVRGASFDVQQVGVTVSHRGERKAILEGIDLRIRPGECLALVGPSGAGKTTLLRTLAAGQPTTSGAIAVDGRGLAGLNSRGLRALRARLGFVHQDHCLVPSLRVSHNVLAGKLGQRGLLASARSMLFPARADLERAHALLEDLGIADKLFQRADTLSGGEAQRVALARALFQEPRALLADEPVAAVDPARGRDLIRRMLDLARQRGLTLIVSLHDVEIARSFFPRSVGLRAGRVVFDRATEELDDADFVQLYELERGMPRD
ncbi:MAG: phosphonate transport system ATP-binding protein [Chlamydiales bacterium]|jgi:phosphonate transport system ATP-binding protein